MPPTEMSLNACKTIPTANPSVPQFFRQDLHKDQKCLENQHIQGHDVPVTQRTSRESGFMPKNPRNGQVPSFFHLLLSHCFSFFLFSLSLSSLLLSAEEKLQYVEHMGKDSLQQHLKKKKKRKSSSEKRFSY